MAVDNFHFVTGTGALLQATSILKQSKEVQAAVRSHAAKVGHARKPVRKINVPRTKCRSHNRPLRKQGPPEQPLRISGLSKSCLLDPFVRLPIELTIEERNLLHNYLTVVPYTTYRTTARSAFCPVRDLTLNAIATNEIWLSWAVLLMEYRQSRLRGRDPEGDPSFISRRRLTYRVMNEKIAASEAATLLDDTVYGVMAAGIAECRVSGEDLGKQHLEAGLTLWRMRRERGYAQRYRSPVELVPCDAYIGIGVKNHFKTHATLVTGLYASIARLEVMQNWNLETRKSVAAHQSLSSVKSAAAADGVYQRARFEATGSNSLLGTYVRCLMLESTVNGIRNCTGILSAINYTLWIWRDKPEATEYLKNLTNYLARSETKECENSPRLTATAVMYIVGHCSALLRRPETPSGAVFDLWDVLEFVEFLMLANTASRRKVQVALTSWLLVPMNEPGRVVLLPEEELKSLVLGVKKNWTMKQSHPAKTSGNPKLPKS